MHSLLLDIRKQKTEVTDKGLKMVEYNDESSIKSKLNGFVVLFLICCFLFFLLSFV